MIKKISLSTTLILGYLFVMVTFAKMYVADNYYVVSQKTLGDGNMGESLEAINSAVKYNPLEPAYFAQRAKVYVASTVSTDEKNTEVLKKLALNDLVTALELNPKNLATLRNTAPIYFFLANKDLAKPAMESNIDEEYVQIAKVYLQQIQQYTPNDVGVQVLAAKYQKRLNLSEDYENTRESIEKLRPDLLQWYPELL